MWKQLLQKREHEKETFKKEEDYHILQKEQEKETFKKEESNRRTKNLT